MIDSSAEFSEEALIKENRQKLGEKGYAELPEGMDLSFGFFADSRRLSNFFRKVDYHSWVKIEGSEEVPAKLSSQEVEFLSDEMSKVENEMVRSATADDTVLRYLFMRQELYRMLGKVKVPVEKLMEMNPNLSKLLAKSSVVRESSGASPFLVEQQFVDSLPARDQIKVR